MLLSYNQRSPYYNLSLSIYFVFYVRGISHWATHSKIFTLILNIIQVSIFQYSEVGRKHALICFKAILFGFSLILNFNYQMDR